VDYTYRISTYAISTSMIDKANAEGGLDITRTNRDPNEPATAVSWNQAARFVNFLNEQAGYSHAYKFEFQPEDPGYGSNQNIQLWDSNDSGYDLNNPYRNANAFYFLPSENEWYKAAFYDPASGNYFLFATSSDMDPTPVSGGSLPNTAIYDGQSGPADVDDAGGQSFYGTMAQSGNTWELMESAWDGTNDTPSELRTGRGGAWLGGVGNLASTHRAVAGPTDQNNGTGFRVAAIPEPSTYAAILGGLGLVMVFLRRVRRNRGGR